ncbi:MAG: hypothetical protein IJK27_01985 [Bacilli bacterium]|nr:hypothetical protein [Bacilli bacterium]
MSNKEKFKAFLKKLGYFFSRYHVIVILTILIPSLIYTGRFLFKGRVHYNNLYFFGNELPVEDSSFKLTGINPLFKLMDVSYVTNYQGAACYDNYYVLCSNNFDALLIYDMNRNKVEHTIITNQTNTDYHCNTCWFGYDFYVSTDKFPILYISMENAPVHATIGFRLYEKAGSYVIEEVTRLTLTFPPEKKVYYPNSYFDYESGLIYYSGYTKNSYMKSDDNKLVYYTFPLPDYREKDVELNIDDAMDTFELPSETATQGGFISHSHLYQTFSFHYKPEVHPDKTPRMRVVDLENKTIIKEYLDLGKEFGQYDEFENITICNNGKMYGHGNIGLKVYEFTYTDK